MSFKRINAIGLLVPQNLGFIIFLSAIVVVVVISPPATQAERSRASAPARASF